MAFLESNIHRLYGVLVNPALGSSPGALDQVVVVDPGEEILLQVVECPARDRLVNAKPFPKGLLGLSAVLELSQEHLAVLYQQRARGVSIVCRLGSFTFHGSQQVVN